ncbi:MAG: hypothetical protein WB696_23240 [Chthoniobacterales bacterium]
MTKKPDQPDRITLDLLARTTFELKRLHDDRNELELISTAYDFLRSCQVELENAPKRIAKMIAHNSGPLIGWKLLQQDVADSDRRESRLLQFFEENSYWARKLLWTNGETRGEGNKLSIEALRKAKFPATGVPDIKEAFAEWHKEKNSEQGALNAAPEKK